MKSVRSIIGLPVLVVSRVVGHVTDVDIDLSKKLFTGIYLTAMPFGVRRIDAENIEIIGDVSVIASDAGKLSLPPPKKAIPAVMADGRRIGQITGALIDEATRRVEAVELSEGVWEDLAYARRWIFSFAAESSTCGVLINPEGGNDHE
ncbi:MAG: hypothetical protein Q4D04_01145 [Clostridia bacterium]|nr:hypothetical protein [Clostridia bacterium]